jgi:predicted nucleic acid-binding protein
VVDASVALKWYLDDEALGTKALEILTSYVSDDLDILAPSLIEYEVINGLNIAKKRGRIAKDKFQTAIKGFFGLEITIHDISYFYEKALELLSSHDISSYDASYLALAEYEQIFFVTADKVLYETVGMKLKYTRWVEDF